MVPYVSYTHYSCTVLVKDCIVFMYRINTENMHIHVCVRACASEFVRMLVHIWHIIHYLWKCTIIPQVAVIREAIIDIT